MAPQEDATGFFSRDASYQLGYLSGASAASYGVAICEEQRAIVAIVQFKQMSKTLILDRDAWIDAWIEGYSDYVTPIMIVICVQGG